MLVMQILFTITGVVKSDPSIQFSWFISFIPVYCRILSPPPPLRLHGVIFTHHQDAAADECQQYTHKAIQIQRKSTFITGDNRYVLFYKISFHNDPVNLFGVWL